MQDTSDETRATRPGPCPRCCANCRYAMPMGHRDETLLVCPCRPDRPGRFTVVEPEEGCREFRERILPEPKADEGTRLIPLVNMDGLCAMVDPADYEWLSQYTWRATSAGHAVYACTHCAGRLCFMHRMIMNPPEGMTVDHKNRCGLDNHRINLRNATQRQNCANRTRAPGVSGYRGVTRCGSKWKAQITGRHGPLRLGLFDDPVEAARAWDRKAIELRGEFARLNFPEEHRVRYVDMQGRITACSGAVARLQCTRRRPAALPSADCVCCCHAEQNDGATAGGAGCPFFAFSGFFRRSPLVRGDAGRRCLACPRPQTTNGRYALTGTLQTGLANAGAPSHAQGTVHAAWQWFPLWARGPPHLPRGPTISG